MKDKMDRENPKWIKINVDPNKKTYGDFEEQFKYKSY
jgi:hypothetical protein